MEKCRSNEFSKCDIAFIVVICAMIPFSFFLFGFYNLLTFPRENIVGYLIVSVGMIILGIIWFFEFGFNEIIPDLLKIAKARIKAWKKEIRKEGTRKTLKEMKGGEKKKK